MSVRLLIMVPLLFLDEDIMPRSVVLHVPNCHDRSYHLFRCHLRPLVRLRERFHSTIASSAVAMCDDGVQSRTGGAVM